MTTIPGRYHLLLDTLKTLISQDYPVDAIYLTIPKIAKRWGTPYPTLPLEIRQLVTVVHVDQDHGPITKIVGGLLMEPDPETLIITADDDIWYSPNLVSSLVKQYLRRPGRAISGSGLFLSSGIISTSCHSQSVFMHNCFMRSWFIDFDVPSGGREVEILCGFSGVLYPRYAFPEPDQLADLLQYAERSDAVFHNDDILLSSYLSSRGIKRVVVPDIPRTDEIRSISNSDDSDSKDGYSLSYDYITCLHRMQDAYQDCVNFGLIKDHPHFSWSETAVGRAVVLIIILIIFILLICVMYYTFGRHWRYPHCGDDFYAASSMVMGVGGAW